MLPVPSVHELGRILCQVVTLPTCSDYLPLCPHACRQVTGIDSTGARTIGTLVSQLAGQGVQVVFSSVPEGAPGRGMRSLLAANGVNMAPFSVAFVGSSLHTTVTGMASTESPLSGHPGGGGVSNSVAAGQQGSGSRSPGQGASSHVPAGLFASIPEASEDCSETTAPSTSTRSSVADGARRQVHTHANMHMQQQQSDVEKGAVTCHPGMGGALDPALVSILSGPSPAVIAAGSAGGSSSGGHCGSSSGVWCWEVGSVSSAMLRVEEEALSLARDAGACGPRRTAMTLADLLAEAQAAQVGMA